MASDIFYQRPIIALRQGISKASWFLVLIPYLAVYEAVYKEKTNFIQDMKLLNTETQNIIIKIIH